jgi:chromosome segregation ATPase
VLAFAALCAAQQPSGEDAQAKKFYEDLIKAPIVPLRNTEDIQEDLKAADKQSKQVDKAVSDAQARITEADGWLATHKHEMDGLKAKLQAAKKEKREADKVTLEGQLKQLDLVEDYLKKTKSIREAERDLAKSQKELVGAGTKVFQGELDLNKKVESIRNADPTSPDLTKIVLEATQAGENTLQAMKTLADTGEDVASRMKRLAERRLELAQARNKLLSEDRIRRAAAGMKK